MMVLKWKSIGRSCSLKFFFVWASEESPSERGNFGGRQNLILFWISRFFNELGGPSSFEPSLQPSLSRVAKIVFFFFHWQA